VVDYQVITLESGWNIISTPRVLSSHEFSVPETTDNFDIYLLDPTSPSNWQTMQGVEQTEFQPLFAYFINNKTGQNQILRFNYNFNLTPAQRLFQRTLQPGWNAIGIASPSYALSQGSVSTDTNNPGNILDSIIGSTGQVVDFTYGNITLDSSKITSSWLSKTASDVNGLNDFRELKGYGVFIKDTTDDYIGSQNLDPITGPISPIGGLTLNKYTVFPNQTYAATGQNLKLAHFNLTADITEAVNISTIRVDLATITYSNVTSLYVQYGATPTSTKATTTASNSWSINYNLAAGQTIEMIVYGTVASGYTNGTASRMDMLVSGTTAGSAASVSTNSGSVLAGQNILFTVGSITSAIDPATPATQAVAGNQTITAAKFKWTAANDDFTIKEVKVKLAANADKVVQKAILKDGTTSLGEATYNSTNNFYFTGLNVSVPRNTVKTLTVDLVLSPPSAETDVLSQQKNVAVTLDWFKYSDSSGVQTNDLNDRVAKDIYVFKSIPTFTKVDVGDQSTNLGNGSTTTLYKFSVGASSQGEVDLKQLKFTITPTNSSGGTANTLSNFQFFRGSTDRTAYVTIQTTAGGSLESATTITDGANTVVVTFDTEESIGAGVTNTYYLKATPAGFTTLSGAKDTVSTKLNGDTPISSDTSLFYVYQTSSGTVQRLATDNSAGGETAENIIWSDKSAELSHSYTSGASSADWANSLGTLLDLPLDSQGIGAP